MTPKFFFKKAYGAFRALGNTPDWVAFDKAVAGVPLRFCVAAGRVRCQAI